MSPLIRLFIVWRTWFVIHKMNSFVVQIFGGNFVEFIPAPFYKSIRIPFAKLTRNVEKWLVWPDR